MLNMQIYIVLFTLLLLLLTYQRNLNLTLNVQIDQLIFYIMAICILLAITHVSLSVFFIVYALLASLYVTIPLARLVIGYNNVNRENFRSLCAFIFSLYVLIPLVNYPNYKLINGSLLLGLFLFGALMTYLKYKKHTFVYAMLFLSHTVTVMFFGIKGYLWILLAEMLMAYMMHFKSVYKKEKHLMSYLQKYKISLQDIVSGVTENSIYSVIVMDKNLTMVYANNFVVKMTGYERDEIIGQSFKMFRSDSTPERIYDSLDLALETGTDWKGIVENQKKDGTRYWEELFITPVMKGSKHIGFISLKYDDSHNFTQRMKLEFEANFDGLTGVMRRKKFVETILDEEESDTSSQKFLIMMDVDRFKDINDQYGHDIGDKVLIIIAHFIREEFGHFGIVSRYGGDEFLIYSKGLTIEAVEAKLHNLRVTIANYSFDDFISDNDIEVSVSIGYAEMISGYEETFKEADEKMYRNKNREIIDRA